MTAEQNNFYEETLRSQQTNRNLMINRKIQTILTFCFISLIFSNFFLIIAFIGHNSVLACSGIFLVILCMVMIAGFRLFQIVLQKKLMRHQVSNIQQNSKDLPTYESLMKEQDNDLPTYQESASIPPIAEGH